MAIQFTQKFASQKQAIYDIVSKSSYYNDDAYNYHTQKGDDNEYLTALYSMKDKALDFDDNQYKYLNYDDQLSYIYAKNGMDRNSNEYKQTMSYLNTRIDDGIKQETFNNLNGFQKTLNSIGGIVGNTLNSMILGTIEGVADAVGTLYEGAAKALGSDYAAQKYREFTTKDITGYHALQQELADYSKAYTYLDKNKIWQVANDVSVGIGQMVPMIAVNALAPGFGTALYFSSMAGNTAYDAISENPDISTSKLLWYTGATTAVEMATEKVSGLLFGGSMIDKAMGLSKGSSAAFSKVKAHWLGRLGIDFLSEASEEMISEIADTVLLETLVKNKSFKDSLGEINMIDVLYAGLIGGLTSIVMSGSELIRARNLGMTSDGNLVDYKTALENGEKVTKLSKSKSLSLLEAMSYSQELLKADNLVDLELKAGGDISVKNMQMSTYVTEAIAKNEKYKKDIANAVIGLSRLLNVAGDTQFKKSSDLLNLTFEDLRSTLNNYVNKAPGVTANIKNVESMYAKLNPGESITINTNLSAKEARLQSFMKDKYGKDVYFVNYGAENGIGAQGTNIMGNTILLDSKFINETSMNSILNTTVKHELAHSLQYDSGILNAKSLYQLKKIFERQTGDQLKIDSSATGDTAIETMSEKQVDALVDAVLFDDLTISKVFGTNQNVFTKIYNWLKDLGNSIKNSPEGSLNKIKYSTLVKSLYKYRKAIARRIGNNQDAMTAQEKLGLTDLQLQELIDSYYPTYENATYAILDKSTSVIAETRYEATNFLRESRRDLTEMQFNYDKVFDPEYYSPEFVNKIMTINPEASFQRNLQDMLINNYGMAINRDGKCLAGVVDISTVINKDFENSIKQGVDNLLQYETVGDILDAKFVARLATPDGFNPINDTKVTYNIVDYSTAPKVMYDPVKQELNVTINRTMNETQQAALYDSIVKELTYAVGNNVQMVSGVAPFYAKTALFESIDKKTMNLLANKVFTDEEYNARKTNLADSLDELAYYIYMTADGIPQDVKLKADQVAKQLDEMVLRYNRNEFKNAKQSGFVTNGVIIKGYGIFTGINLQVNNAVDTMIRNEIAAEQRQISFAKKAFGRANTYNKQFVDFITNNAENPEPKLRELGFSEADIEDLRNGKFTNSRMIADVTNTVLNPLASKTEVRKTNLLLKFLTKDNKFVKTRNDIDSIINYDYARTKVLNDLLTPNSQLNQDIKKEYYDYFLSQLPVGTQQTPALLKAFEQQFNKYQEKLDIQKVNTTGKTVNEISDAIQKELDKVSRKNVVNSYINKYQTTIDVLQKDAKAQLVTKLINSDYDFSPSKTSNLGATIYQLGTEYAKETQAVSGTSKDSEIDDLSSTKYSRGDYFEGGEEDFGLGIDDEHFAELREKVATKGIESLTEKELKDYNIFVKPELEEELEQPREVELTEETRALGYKNMASSVSGKSLNDIKKNAVGALLTEYAKNNDIKDTSAEFVLYKFLTDNQNGVGLTDDAAKNILTYTTDDGEKIVFKPRADLEQNISNNRKTINDTLKERNLRLTGADLDILNTNYKNFETPDELRNYYKQLKDLNSRIKKGTANTETGYTDLLEKYSAVTEKVEEPVVEKEAPVTIRKISELSAEEQSKIFKKQTTLQEYQVKMKQQEVKPESREELSKTALHYGTIQTEHKAETLQTGLHETGGFGTGTYFMSDKSTDKSLTTRNKNVIDISEYKTFNPKTNEDALQLHEDLKDFEKSVLTDSTDYDYVPSLTSLLGISTNRLTEILSDARDRYDKYVERNGDSFDWKPKTAGELDKIDKPQTYLMKRLGYEGINTLGLPDVDNSKYGTVIFDLKEPSPLETKTEQQQQQQQQRKRSAKAERIAKSIADKIDDTITGLSETQSYDRFGKEFQSLPESVYDDVQIQLLELSNVEEYKDVEAAIKESTRPNADQIKNVFVLASGDIADLMNITTDIGDYAKEAAGKKATDAAQALAHLSHKERTYTKNQRDEYSGMTSIVNSFTKDGTTVNMTEENYGKLDKEFANLNQKLNSLQDDFAKLQESLKNESNGLEQRVILDELKKIGAQINAIQNNDTGAILDMIVNKATTREAQAELVQKSIKEIAETATKEDQPVDTKTAKDKMLKIFRKIRSYRMWAMTSSPTSWFNNYIGNTLQRGLDSVSKVIERQINKIDTIKGLYRDTDIKMNSDKASKDAYDRFYNKYKTVVDNFVNGTEGKYSDLSGDAAISTLRERREVELKSAKGFRRFELLMQKYSDWGLQKGPLGDERMMKITMTKNFMDIMASNKTALLEELQRDLASGANNTPRAIEIEKALNTKDPVDIADALSQQSFESYMDYALRRAAETYFKNPNALSDWVNSMAKEHPIRAEIFAACVTPFPKVAGNILKMAYSYSPLNLISIFKKWGIIQQLRTNTLDLKLKEKYVKTGEDRVLVSEFVQDISRAAIGTTGLIAGAIASALGLVRIDDDDYMGVCLNIPVINLKMSLNDLAPSALPFTTAASMAYAFKNKENGFLAAFDNICDNTLLSNITSVFNYSSKENYFQSITTSYVSSYIPALVKTTNKFFTGNTLKDKSASTYFGKLYNTLISYVPFVSNLVPNKIDPYTGKPQYAAGSANWIANTWNALTPFDVKTLSSSDLEIEAKSLDKETTGLSGSFTINGQNIKIYGFQKENLAKYRANYINDMYQKYISGATMVTVKDESTGKTKTVNYNKLTDAEKKNALNNLYTTATTITKIKYWLSQGNEYHTKNSNEYYQYKKLFSQYGSQIKYNAKLTGSGYIEK